MYALPKCPRCQKMARQLRELGVKYEKVVLPATGTLAALEESEGRKMASKVLGLLSLQGDKFPAILTHDGKYAVKWNLLNGR
jgi:glutaredoxin